MSQDSPIYHIDQYVGLPELEIPVVVDGAGSGRICRVLAVDFFIALPSDCRQRGIEAFEIPSIGRCALPAVTLDEDNNVTCYRLPNSLSEWIYELMRDPHYEAQFPAVVEFGLHRDEHYARFVTAAPQTL